MSKASKVRGLSRALVLTLAAGLAATARAQVTTAQWTTATSGNWTDAARWSSNPFSPNNGNGAPLYRAEFLATGANYTVTLSSDVALDSLLLNSANATIAHTSGVLTILGTATLSAGTFNLNGGTIRGGTLDNTANHLSVSSSTSNMLDGVALLGSLSLGSTNNLRVMNGFSTTGTISLTTAGAALVFDNSQTFSSGVVSFTQFIGSAEIAIEGSSTLTLGAGAEIRGKSATIGSQRYATGSNALVNDGLLNANTGGGILTVVTSSTVNNGMMRAAGGVINTNSANFVNNGAVQANTGSINFSAGGTRRNDGAMSVGTGAAMSLGGTWSKLGAVTQTGGTLTMAGVYDTTSGFTLNKTGGTLNFSGTFNNAGSSLSFSTGGGAWNVDSATFNGGSLTFTGGGNAMNLTGRFGRMYGLTFNGNLTSSGDSATSEIRQGLTLNGTWTFAGRGTVLDLAESQTVGGTATFAFSGADNLGRSMWGRSGTTLTLGADVVVRGETGTIGGEAGCTWQGQGRVSADVSAKMLTLDLHAAAFQNQGVVEAINGGTLLIQGNNSATQTFTSTGTVRAGAGSTVRFDATKVSLAGSTVENAGTFLFNGAVLDNTGHALNLNAAGGAWVFDGGTIRGGTVTATGGVLSTPSNLWLEGVAFNGDLSGNVTAAGSSISGTATVGSGKLFTGTGVWTANAQFTLNGGVLEMRDNVTLGAGFGVVNTGGEIRLTGAQVHNAGHTLEVNAATGLWTMDTTSRISGGVLRFRDGASIVSRGIFENTTIDGSFRIGPGQNGQGPSFTGSVTGGEILLYGAGAVAGLSGGVDLNSNVTFTGSNNVLNVQIAQLGAGSVIQSVSGASGTIGGSGSLNNLGELRADGVGAVLNATATIDNGQGRLRALNGGLLSLQQISATGDLASIGAGSFLVLGGTYTLDGPTSASAGGSLTLSGTWSNAGTINLDHGTLTAAGTYSTASFGAIAANASTIRLAGVCDNTGGSLGFSGADLKLAGAWITGGAINSASAVTADLGQTVLTGVTVNSDLNIQGVRLDLVGGALNGATTLTAGGTLFLAGAWTNAGGITVVDSTLNVGGSVDLAHLGTITRSGASAVNLSGTLDATGQSVHWTGSSFFSAVNGGAITAHRIDIDSGVVLTMTSGTLNTPVIGGGGTVRVNSGNAFIANNETGPGPLTIEAGATVECAGGVAWLAAYNPLAGQSVVNNGTLRTTSGAGALNIGGDTFVNNGLVDASAGMVTLGLVGQTNPVWENHGTLRASSGGMLMLRGSTTTAGLGTIRQTGGGIVALDGQIDNTGATLTLGAGAVEALLNEHSRVIGGNLTTVAGSRIFASGRLEGVHITGDVDVNELTLAGGTTLSSGLYLTNFASLFIDGSVGLDAGSINFSGAGGLTDVSFKNNASLSLGAGVLVHGGNAQVRMDFGVPFYSDSTLTNLGVIRADLSGQRLDLSIRRFDNQGTIEAVTGGVLSVGQSGNGRVEWSNSGTIRAASGGTVELYGVLTLLAGSTLENSGGVIKLRGTLDNSGSTLALDASTGSLTVASGTIRGGTVTTAGGAEVLVDRSGFFDAATINGAVRVGDAGNMFIRNGFNQTGVTHLSGSNSALIANAGDAALSSGTFAFESTGARARILAESAGPATLTIGAAAVVRGGNGSLITSSASTIINQGRVSADVAGQSIQVYLARFFNQGVLEAVNGGVLDLVPSGGFQQDALPALSNSGVITIGLGSRLGLNGDLTLESTGSLEAVFLAGGETDAGPRLVVNGTLALGGTLRLEVMNAGALVDGAAFDVFDAGAVTGRADAVILPTLGRDLAWDTSGLTWNGIVRVVPSPAGLLVLAGLSVPSRRRGSKGGAL